MQANPILEQRAVRPGLKPLNAAAVSVQNRFYGSAEVPLAPLGALHWGPAGARFYTGIHCTAAGGSLWWGLQPWSALDPLFDADFSHVPPPVLLLALDAAAAPLLRHFESLWGGPIDAVACGPMPAELALPGGAVELGFSLRGDAGEILARGALFASVAALQGAALRLPQQSHAAERGAIPVWVGIELSRIRLSLAELLDLAPGDAIRIGRVPVAPQPRRVTLAPGGRPMLIARLNEQQQLIVESTVANPEENPVITQGSSELDALDDVQCTVSFEVGRLQMSVAEVAALRAGSTVALASRLDDQPVWIVVNGQRVGRGDLAEVGDELVVVVTALRR